MSSSQHYIVNAGIIENVLSVNLSEATHLSASQSVPLETPAPADYLPVSIPST